MERSVCYANPALLLRRPISELLALQEGKRALGLLIPARGAAHEQQLHHTRLFKEATVHTYRAWQPPGPFEWPIPGPGFLRQAWRALRDYDTIHCWGHFYPSTLLLLLLSLFHRKTRIILTIDTLPGYSFSAGPLLDAAFRLYTWTVGRIVYGLPDRITLYGRALLPHARRSGIGEKKLAVLPTGLIEHPLPSRKEARRQLAEELGLRPGSRVVLYAGLLNPRKRVHDLLETARQLQEALFLIAGDGPSRKDLEKAARGMRNVRFLGWRHDLLALLRASDALLFPSGGEGLPGIVMEAMYCGTPVVTTRIPCTTDLIEDGKEGLLCRVGDTACMARQLRRLGKREEAKRLAAAARRRIRNGYSWKRLLPRYERLWEAKLCKRRPRAAGKVEG